MNSHSDSKRRVALVTGRSGGIGREIAIRLASDGFAIVVNYAGNVAEANAVVAEIEAAGNALTVKADVADETAVSAMFGSAEQTFGGIDVVVQAAGIMPLAPLAELDLDVFDRMLRTNLRGTFVVDQQSVRRIRRGGTIVNFSSSVLALALPNYSAYTASKGGVEVITLILARELRGRDVTINAVAPGPTATPLFMNGPFRVHIDPADDGAAVVNAVADRVRAEFLTRIGLADVLHPTTLVHA